MAKIELTITNHLGNDPVVYMEQMELLFKTVDPIRPEDPKVQRFLDAVGAPAGFYTTGDIDHWGRKRYERARARETPLEYNLFDIHALLLDPDKPWRCSRTGLVANTFVQRVDMAVAVRELWLTVVMPAQRNREAQARWRQRHRKEGVVSPEAKQKAEALKAAYDEWMAACRNRDAKAEELRELRVVARELKKAWEYLKEKG